MTMYDTEKLKALGATNRQCRFARFLDDNRGDSALADYRKLDLMTIPDLVPDLWVLDFRKGIDGGLLFLFSGTRIDDRHGRNLMGHTLESIYTGHYNEEVFGAYREVYRKSRGVFVARSDFYENFGRHNERKIKVLLYPCSPDGETIDFAVGMTVYQLTDSDRLTEPVVTYL